MMIIGSTTRLGQTFIKNLKSAHKNITLKIYDDYKECNKDELSKVIQYTDVIISFRGGSLLSLAHNIQVMSATANHGKKFMLITSFGCGDSWNNLSDNAKRVFGDKVKYKTLSEVWLQLSDLPWKIIRPVGLSDVSTGGKTIVTDKKELVNGYVNRDCLAKVLVDNVINSHWNGREILYVYAS